MVFSRPNRRPRRSAARLKRWLPALTAALAVVMSAVFVPVPASAQPARTSATETVAIDGIGELRIAAEPAPEDLVLTLDLDQPFNRDVMAGVVQNVNSRNERLSDTIRQYRLETPTGLPHGGVAGMVDFDGTLTLGASTLELRIPRNQVDATASWLVEAAAGALGILVGVAAEAICVAAFPNPLCLALGGAIGGAIPAFIILAVDGALLTFDGAMKVLTASIFGAITGVFGGENAVKFVKDFVVPTVKGAARGMLSIARKLSSWLSFLRNPMETSAALLDAISNGLPDAIRWIQQGRTTALRVMPLGDSITLGVGSSTESSYRMEFQRLLHERGFGYQFVGSQASGSPPSGSPAPADRDHEGHSGWRIDQIAASLPSWLATYRPSVVTLHLGTNDMIQNYQTGTAVDRLGAVIDQIFASDPDITVVVSSLVPSRTPAINDRIKQFNQRMLSMVKARMNAGRHLVHVDMDSLVPGDIADDVHPSDGGYVKMARIFTIGVLAAAAGQWLRAPHPPGDGPTQRCTDDPGDGSTDDPGDGSGDDPGDTPTSIPRVARFADFNGDLRDDYIAVAPSNGSVWTWLNNGADAAGDHWIACGLTASGSNTGVGAGGRQVEFADINGDRRDDYLAVDPRDGSVHAWQNDGAERGGDHWIDRGVIASGVNTGVGVGARQVQFADINGDFRDDYLAVDPRDGSVHAWQNDGVERGADRWIDRGIIASGTNTGVSAGGPQARFADLNNDNKADFLVIDQTNGSLRAWLNQDAFLGGDRWNSRGVIASGASTEVGQGRQAWLADLNGDQMDDYLALNPSNGSVRGWLNVRAYDPGDQWLDRGVIASGTNTGVRS